ncbi:unnamed protein product [Vitrella brassicaformis CCMP3155]|uniref:Tubulin--tyrosine ligase-like protein 5 n=1 Tax=Vitrella brassicaformis (strain CCMP3155) TaxID=1169540 RepID=A0A0G4H5W5_VITBC|nr:unnamed protein product [Vitrella brassicaformis CCMP3155]|eukprot:CEM39238.1 unnamed protein product [Vitrella brassicaformis CCMP3155]
MKRRPHGRHLPLWPSVSSTLRYYFGHVWSAAAPPSPPLPPASRLWVKRHRTATFCISLLLNSLPLVFILVVILNFIELPHPAPHVLTMWTWVSPERRATREEPGGRSSTLFPRRTLFSALTSWLGDETIDPLREICDQLPLTPPRGPLSLYEDGVQSPFDSSVMAPSLPPTIRLDSHPHTPAYGDFADAFMFMWGGLGLQIAIDHEPPPRDFGVLWIRKQGCEPKLREYDMKALTEVGMVNHVPGTCEEAYRKTAFCRAVKNGDPREFEPDQIMGVQTSLPCFVVPENATALESYIAEHPREVWISKQPAQSGGIGHQIHWEGHTAVERARRFMQEGEGTGNVAAWDGEADHDSKWSYGHLLYQRYIHNPLLWDGRKFDIRVFMVVFWDPLRIYIHRNGKARLGGETYQQNNNSEVMQITTAGVQEIPDSFRIRPDPEIWDWLTPDKAGPLFEKIKKICANAILSFAHKLGCNSSQYGGYKCGRVFQFFGLDVVLDEELNPYVIEVNNDPGFGNLATDLAHAASETGGGCDSRYRSTMAMYREVHADILRVIGYDPFRRLFVERPIAAQPLQSGDFELTFPSPVHPKLCEWHAREVGSTCEELYRDFPWAFERLPASDKALTAMWRTDV